MPLVAVDEVAHVLPLPVHVDVSVPLRFLFVFPFHFLVVLFLAHVLPLSGERKEEAGAQAHSYLKRIEWGFAGGCDRCLVSAAEPKAAALLETEPLGIPATVISLIDHLVREESVLVSLVVEKQIVLNLIEVRFPQTRWCLQPTGLDLLTTRAHLDGKQAYFQEAAREAPEARRWLGATVPQTRWGLQRTGLDSGVKARMYLKASETCWHFELEVSLLRIGGPTFSDAMKSEYADFADLFKLDGVHIVVPPWDVVSIILSISSNSFRDKRAIDPMIALYTFKNDGTNP